MSGGLLADGTKIGGGPVASVVAGASELVVGVCTAGSQISGRITEHQQDGQRLRAMFLDDLGSWAVDQAPAGVPYDRGRRDRPRLVGQRLALTRRIRAGRSPSSR